MMKREKYPGLYTGLLALLLVFLFSGALSAGVEVKFIGFLKDKLFPPKDEQRIEMERPEDYRARLKELDKYYSDKKLGAYVEKGQTVFRLFAPQAEAVSVVLFKAADDNKGQTYTMMRDSNGVWETTIGNALYNLYYGFYVSKKGAPQDSNKVLVLDPYAKAVTTYNTFLGQRKGIILPPDEFDWDGTKGVAQDWRDLIIYEAHVRDLTAHPSSGAKHPGTYKGLTEKNIKGGLPYIKALGVNTVELLPSMEFANIELPYKQEMLGRTNTWNPYERNHWGYMTAAFFAPEAYYAEDWKSLQWNTWEGKSGKQVNEFKSMVKAFHKEGIAVIMDVVFNHLSEYELGNLKEIDHEYYFRLDDKGKYIAESGCGNDLHTERPMVRRMIVESILHWMKEYHVDGFRFDLGKLIDWGTLEAIIKEARKVNPNVVFVAEPWGGGYDPKGFSLRDWGSWNDQIRNGVKGENPNNGLGWIFGSWYGNNSPQRLQSYINGTLVKDEHGLFQKKEHSVNYLESHDGYTLGDFIRIGLREAKPDAPVDKDIKLLSPRQLKLNKLAALFLFTSQGITMIHSGQEFARAKVIPKTEGIEDSHAGRLDHNSYEKDNTANYINYKEAAANSDLLEYYKGLIALRKMYPAFRHAAYEEITFYKNTDNKFAIGFQVTHGGEQFIVLMNGHTTQFEDFKLPAGEWEVLVSPQKAGVKTQGSKKDKLIVDPSCGYVLKKKKESK